MAWLRLVAFDCQPARQADDPTGISPYSMVNDYGVRQAGPVEVTLDPGREDGLRTAVGDADDLERDQGGEDLLFAPGLDRGKAAELPADVVHDGGVGEERDEGGGGVVVDRPDVGSGGPRQFGCHG